MTDDIMARWMALPARARDKIIEHHRYRDVEVYSWWDSTFEDFTCRLGTEYGIHVQSCYFSGFYSQGDGACFDGYVSNWEVFLPKLGYDVSQLIDLASQEWSFACEHAGCYYHEYSVDYNISLAFDDYYDDDTLIKAFGPAPNDPDDLRNIVWLEVLKQVDIELLEKHAKELFRSLMQELYSELEDEYDHLTSDEAVLESLHANGLLDEVISEWEAENAEEQETA
jgi:hypothetical protein